MSSCFVKTSNRIGKYKITSPWEITEADLFDVVDLPCSQLFEQWCFRFKGQIKLKNQNMIPRYPPKKCTLTFSLQVHWLAAFNQIGKGGTVHVLNIYFSHSKLISLQKLPGWKKDSEITPTLLKSRPSSGLSRLIQVSTICRGLFS